MDRAALVIAAGWGVIAQLLLAAAGHFIGFFAEELLFIAGVLIAVGTGAIYVRKAPTTTLPLMGGAAAAAVGAFAGALLSLLLGDVGAIMLLLGPLGAALAGSAGAAFARALRARRRR